MKAAPIVGYRQCNSVLLRNNLDRYLRRPAVSCDICQRLLSDTKQALLHNQWQFMLALVVYLRDNFIVLGPLGDIGAQCLDQPDFVEGGWA
jgi:hypothetical protein